MKGKCYFCNKEFTKAGILKHIKSCPAMKEYMVEDEQSSKVKKNKFILSIMPNYDVHWIYIAINKTATLKELDEFLRDVWLECCGHLSSFEINNTTYDSVVDYTWKSNSKDMNVKLKDVITLKDKMNYQYDFGSTTDLTIKVVGELSSSRIGKKIEILARNNAPQVECSKCNNKALYYDIENYEYLCEKCYHNIDEEDRELINEMEYWNSPRDGVCGYYGEKSNEDPYVPTINKVKNVDKINNSNKVIDINEILKMKNELEDVDSLIELEENNDFEDYDFFEDEIDEKIDKLFEICVKKSVNSIKKMWTPMKKDSSLEYNLSRLTKKELLNIADNLNIKKVSSLKKKDLKNRILDLYNEKMSLYIETMDVTRFQLIVDWAQKKIVDIQKPYDFNLEDIIFFRSKGLVFTGKIDDTDAIIIPDETVSIILNKNTKEFKEQLLKNQEIIRLFWGMCHYYGVISLNDFTRLSKRYIDYDITNMDLVTLIKEASLYYKEFNFNGELGINIIVDDWEYIYQEQCKREDLNFYTFTKEDLLEVAIENYDENSAAFKKFHKYLTNNFNVDEDEIEQLMFEIEVAIKNDENFGEVFQAFLYVFNFNDMDEANDMLSELNKFANNTRQWVIKGYTPTEVLNLQNSSNLNKVGRNDPCPCGSGKKYKKCCLNKN